MEMHHQLISALQLKPQVGCTVNKPDIFSTGQREGTLWPVCGWLPIILNELLYSVIHLLGSLNSGGKTSEKYLLGLLTRSSHHKPTDSPTRVFEVCELSVHLMEGEMFILVLGNIRDTIYLIISKMSCTWRAKNIVLD